MIYKNINQFTLFYVWLLLLYSGNSLAQTSHIISIFSSPTSLVTYSDAPQTLTVLYQNNRNAINLKGLTLNVHFNSNQLKLSNISNIANLSTLNTFTHSAVAEDQTNSDQNASTNQLVNITWLDIDSNWPKKADSIALTTFRLSPVVGFLGASTITFTTASTTTDSNGVAYQVTTTPSQFSRLISTTPSVSIKATIISSKNVTHYQVNGACSHNNINVVIVIGSIFSQAVPCTSNRWQTGSTDISVLNEGIINISAIHKNQIDALTQTNVTVLKDTLGPKFVFTHPTLTVEATGPLTHIAFISGVQAIDAVDGEAASSTFSIDNQGPFPLGSTTITWTAQDTLGNSTTALQVIHVIDTTPPTLIPPNDRTFAATSISTTIPLIKLGIAKAADIHDVSLTPTVSSQSSLTFPVGSSTVIWVVTDRSGNTASATQKVLITDNSAPIVTAPADIVQEATSKINVVNLGIAKVQDAIESGLIAKSSTTGPFPLGTSSVIWSASDSMGNTGYATQTVTLVDTTAPAILFATSTHTLKSQSSFTRFNITNDLGVRINEIFSLSISVTSTTVLLIQKPLTLTSDLILSTGVHQLFFTAKDSNGNSSQRTLTVHITPVVDFSQQQEINAGSHFNISAHLNGPPINYPVTIPFTINSKSTANNPSAHNVKSGNIIIELGNLSSSRTFSTTKLITADSTIIFDMGTPTHAVLGQNTQHQVTIKVANIAPRPNPIIFQGGTKTAIVTSQGGTVQIDANTIDDKAQSLTFDWSQSDLRLLSNLVTGTDSQSDVLNIMPNSLSPDVYSLNVTVNDGMTSTSVFRYFKVIQDSHLTQDTDDDGIADTDDLASLTENLLPLDAATSVVSNIKTAPGVKLRLGRTALKASKHGVLIQPTDLPTSAQQAIADYTVNQIVDYEVSNLPTIGSSIQVIVPLKQATTANSTLRKYNPLSTPLPIWSDFVIDTRNQIYSAISINPNGVCPDIASRLYQPITSSTLPPQQWCLQLEIEDGGPNDADGLPNGVVLDPVAVLNIIPSTLTATKSTHSPSDGAVLANSKNNILLVFGLTSNSNNLLINELDIQASGSGDDSSTITDVKLYSDFNNDGAIDGETLLGSERFSTDNGTLTIRLSTPVKVNTVQSYFILSYDINQ